MTVAMGVVLGVVMLFTAFLSGVFGMAGGLVLIGVLLALLPLPDAMALHAVTQMASNGWRTALWFRYIDFRAAWPFCLGYAVAVLVWSFTQFVPPLPVALLMLGASPLLVRLLPSSLRPNPFSVRQGVVYGAISMTLMLLTGVSGPLVDTFFLGGGLDRRTIVATKAAAQVAGHGAKLLYFGALVGGGAGLSPWLAAMGVLTSIVGTSLARRVLEALSDQQYRRWATHIITVIAVFYLLQGGTMLARSSMH